MKKILILAAALVSFSAVAAVLTKEVVEGTKRVCIYSDGSAISISAASVCPQTK